MCSESGVTAVLPVHWFVCRDGMQVSAEGTNFEYRWLVRAAACNLTRELPLPQEVNGFPREWWEVEPLSFCRFVPFFPLSRWEGFVYQNTSVWMEEKEAGSL